MLLTNAEAFAALSIDQQAALQDSAAAAVPGAMEAARNEDREDAAEVCRSGMTFEVASDDDLASFQTAFEPVYAELASDRSTAESLDAISAIKDELGAPANSAECAAAASAGTAPTDRSGFPQGRFESTITDDDWAVSETDVEDVAGTFTMAIEPGVLSILQPVTGDVGFAGEYTVFQDRIEVVSGTDTVTAR